MCRQHHDLREFLWASHMFWDIQTVYSLLGLLILLLKGSIHPFAYENIASLWSEIYCTLKALFCNTVIEKKKHFPSKIKLGEELLIGRHEKIIREHIHSHSVRSFMIRNVSCQNILCVKCRFSDNIYSPKNISAVINSYSQVRMDSALLKGIIPVCERSTFAS